MGFYERKVKNMKNIFGNLSEERVGTLIELSIGLFTIAMMLSIFTIDCVDAVDCISDMAWRAKLCTYDVWHPL